MTESFSDDQNVFGEIRRHTYSVPDNFESVWQDIQKRPEFSEWQDALNRINDQKISEDFNKLSIAAKVHYIVDWKKEGTIEDIKQIAKEYGWKVGDEDIKSVLSFLEELDLVTTDESDDIPF